MGVEQEVAAGAIGGGSEAAKTESLVVSRLFKDAWRESLMANAAFYGAAILCIAAGTVTAWYYGLEIDYRLYNRNIIFMAPSLFCLSILVYSGYIVVVERPSKPLYRIFVEGPRRIEAVPRMLYGVPVLIFAPVVVSIYTSIKFQLAKIVPFYSDIVAADIDAALHGMEAWRLIHPIVGYPIVTSTINFFYHMWFGVIYAVLVLAAFMVGRRRLRAQFLVSFALCWILLGNGLATALSSVGPCFYEEFYGSDRYAELFAYLRQADLSYPVPALKVQDLLLATYHSATIDVGRGISALPSMHVALTALIAIFAWKVRRSLGYLGLAFLIAIQIGSVHLGWHYAIDGYLAIACVALIWKLSGHISAFTESFISNQQLADGNINRASRQRRSVAR